MLEVSVFTVSGFAVRQLWLRLSSLGRGRFRLPGSRVPGLGFRVCSLRSKESGVGGSKYGTLIPSVEEPKSMYGSHFMKPL